MTGVRSRHVGVPSTPADVRERAVWRCHGRRRHTIAPVTDPTGGANGADQGSITEPAGTVQGVTYVTQSSANEWLAAA